MATGRRWLTAGTRGNQAKACLSLRVEPLESRTVLSALGLPGPAIFAAGMSADPSPIPVETVSTKFNEDVLTGGVPFDFAFPGLADRNANPDKPAGFMPDSSMSRPELGAPMEDGFVAVAVPFLAAPYRPADQFLAAMEHLMVSDPWAFPGGPGAPDVRHGFAQPAATDDGFDVSNAGGSEGAGSMFVSAPAPAPSPASAPAAAAVPDDFVVVVNVPSVQFYRPASQTVVTAALSAPARPSAFSSEANVPRDFTLALSAHPSASPTAPLSNEQESKPAGSTAGTSTASSQVGAAIEGGLVDIGNASSGQHSLPVGQSQATLEPTTTSRVPAVLGGASVPQDFLSRENARMNAPLSKDDGGGPADVTPDPSRTATPTNSPQQPGGPVESDAVPEASPRSPQAADDTPSWNSPDTTPSGPVAPGTSRVDGGLDASRVAGEDHQRADNPEEGGMVELAEASAADSTRAVPTATVAADPEQPRSVKEVPIESGVGQFHAFDLATVLNEQDDQGDSAAEEATEADVPPEATSLPPPPESPAANTSVSAARASDGRAVRAAGPLPAVTVAALLAAIDAVHLEEASDQRRRGGKVGRAVSSDFSRS